MWLRIGLVALALRCARADEIEVEIGAAGGAAAPEAGGRLDAVRNEKAGVPVLLDVAQWLHSAGAPLDAIDHGYTPLHCACSEGCLDVVQWLCSAGADATLETNDGCTPAQLLQRRARNVRLDQQALRITMACLVRRAQGPPLCTTAP